MSLQPLRWLGLLVVLAGCPAAQTFTTARTLPVGTVQHTIGVESLGAVVDETTCTEGEEGCVSDPIGWVAIPFPMYGMRAGLTEQLEIGGRFSFAGQAGVDLKVQLVRSEAFDLAIDPSISSSFGFGFFSLPILASLNIGDAVTLTLAPKASYLLLFGDNDSLVDGFFLGGGANIQIRIADAVAFTPGFDYQRLMGTDETGLAFFSVGIGLSFGAFPTYGTQAAPTIQPAAPTTPPGYGPT